MNQMRESQSLLPDGGSEQVRYMKQIVVSATIPFTVEFKRRRRRTVENLFVWDEAAVAIWDVNDREAPVAYRIDPCVPSGTGYDIRSFRGGIWWPVFDGSQALSVDAFLARFDDPNGCFLAAMNLSPTTLHSSREVTTKSFDKDVSIRRVLESSKEDRLILGHRAASRFLVCGGYVYQEGGEPAYFGTPSDKCDMARLSLRIGGLQVGCNQPGDRWHLGLSANQRRRAAYRSFVFHVDEVDEACLALKSEGLRPGFEESATIVDGATRRMDVAEYCADAVARAILRPSTRLSNDYHATMMTFSAFANFDGPISRQIAREIIREGLAVVALSDFRKSFGIAQEWARKATDRLDRRFPSPALSPEEDEILLQMVAG